MMARAMGVSLRVLGWFAGSDLAERWGLRKPAEQLLRRGAKAAFQGAAVAARAFKPGEARATPERLPASAKRPDLFDLNLSEEQTMIRESVRQFTDEVVRPAAAKADEACAPSADFLQRFDELGVRLLAIPEALGGMGGERSPLTNALVLEELARGDMGLAFAAAAPLAVIHALVDGGTAAQQAKYLAAFAEEEPFPAAFALVEPRPLFDAAKLATKARRNADGFVLSGEKSMVPWSKSAPLFLVAAELEGAGPRLFLVERAAAGLAIEPDPSMGLRAADLGRLRFHDVALPSDALLGGNEPALDYGSVVDRARMAWSAMAVGAGQAVLDYVVPYCNERVAFGESITNRQSVAFLIANIAIELDGLRLVLYRAASRAEHGQSFRREAALARSLAAEKGMEIGTNGVQLLGGHGFVKEHPVELWYRHLRAIGIAEGGLLV